MIFQKFRRVHAQKPSSLCLNAFAVPDFLIFQSQHWPQRKLQSLALNDLMYRQELAQKVNEATNTDLGPRYCRTLSCI